MREYTSGRGPIRPCTISPIFGSLPHALLSVLLGWLRCTAQWTGNTTDSVRNRDRPIIRQTDPAYSYWNILIIVFVVGLEWIRVPGEWSRCCRLPNRASALMVIARETWGSAARRCAIMVFNTNQQVSQRQGWRKDGDERKNGPNAPLR